MRTFMHVLFDYLVRTAVQIIGMVMLLSILAQIFTRFLATPIPWTDEMARGAFIWLCFLGAALAMRQYAHLGIDYFRSRLTGKGQFISDLIVCVSVVVFGVLVAYLGFKLLGVVGRQRTPIMRISMQWFYAVLPISGALMALQGVEFLIGHIVTGKPRPPIEEAALPPTDSSLI